MGFVFAKASQIFMLVSAFERGAAGGAAAGFADAVCCKIMAERMACHRQCEKGTFSSPVTCHPCFQS